LDVHAEDQRRKRLRFAGVSQALGSRRTFHHSKASDIVAKTVWELLGGEEKTKSQWWDAAELSDGFLRHINYTKKENYPLKRMVIKYLAWGANPELLAKYTGGELEGLSRDVMMELKSVWETRVNTYSIGDYLYFTQVGELEEFTEYYVEEV